MNRSAADQEIDLLRKGAHLEINSNGYAFQYAAIAALRRLAMEERSLLFPVVAEFPVEVGDRTTHIDALLRDKKSPFYLVCEFKRADPARANWCFFRAPFVSNAINSRERIVREVIERDDATGECHLALDWRYPAPDRHVYRLAIALQSHGKGESQTARTFFDDALKQVTLGINGLLSLAYRRIERGESLFIVEDPGFWRPARTAASFMPIIITTAKLWTADADLSTAELATGDIDRANINPVETPWLYFQHAQSPGLMHGAQRRKDKPRHIPDLLSIEYTRTVCVVSIAGLEDFLNEWSRDLEWIAWGH